VVTWELLRRDDMIEAVLHPKARSCRYLSCLRAPPRFDRRTVSGAANRGRAWLVNTLRACDLEVPECPLAYLD
jgi:hypothetical protein